MTNAPLVSTAAGEQEQSGGGFSFLPQPTPPSQPSAFPLAKRPDHGQSLPASAQWLAGGMSGELEDDVRRLGSGPRAMGASVIISGGGGGVQDDDTCCLFQQLIRSKGVQCSVLPGDVGRGGPSRSTTPPTTLDQLKGTAPLPKAPQQQQQQQVASAQKQAKVAQLSSTLEALENLWVTSGQAALTPRKAAQRAEEEASSNIVEDRAGPLRDKALAAEGVAPARTITPEVPSTALIHTTKVGSTIQGSAIRTLSPGTSKLLAQVYGTSGR